jgi:hypothetical protein
MIFIPFFLLAISCVNAEIVYYTVIYGDSVPDNVEKIVVEDTSLLLETLDGSTSPEFAVTEPGEPLPGTRQLSNSDRDLFSIRCPSRCDGSTSRYCQSLGCVVCPNCDDRRRRNLRGLQSDNTTVVDAEAVAMTIQENLDMELSMYCPTAGNCELWARVYSVHEDGNITEVLPV